MIDLFNDKGVDMPGRIELLEADVQLLKLSHLECEAKHNQHTQYRHEADSKMDAFLEYQRSSSETLNKILRFMEDNSPHLVFIKDNLSTISRTRNTQTTFDTLKSWGSWIGVFTGVMAAAYGFIHFIRFGIS